MKGKFANLSDRLSAKPSAEQDDEKKEKPKPGQAGDQDDNEEDQDMTDEEKTALTSEAREEGRKAGLKEANDRMNAVLAADEYEGREKLAHSMLATDLSADDIVKQLAAAPKVEAGAEISEEDKKALIDEGKKAGMAEALGTDKNSDVEDGDDDTKADAGDVMKNAVGKINKQRKPANA